MLHIVAKRNPRNRFGSQRWFDALIRYSADAQTFDGAREGVSAAYAD